MTDKVEQQTDQAIEQMTEQNELKITDAFIAGGGPVGLMLAIGLARQNRQVVLVEKNQPKKGEVGSFDGRVLALTYGSKLALEKLGLWQALEPFTTPIRHVHVSQKGYLGLTYLHAEEMQVPALGYSITASDLGQVLWQEAQQYEQIQLHVGAGLVDFEPENDLQRVRVETQSGEESFLTRLVIGADGTQSKVRQVLGLEMESKSYDAFGVIAKIETEQHPEGWSFERFTEQGPTALLPMDGHFHKAVWVVPKDEIDAVMALDDVAYMQGFAERMGERLGRFVSVSPREAYPLTESYVPQMTQGRAVLMGNASHTQHPVAAQGLNLGIRDIDEFLQLAESQDDLGNQGMLNLYAEQRQADHERIMGLTDGLISVFQNDSAVVGHLRGLGLMAMNILPKTRRRFARMTMGLKA